MTSPKIKVSIVGITGFTGTELLRVLLQHPDIEITGLISRQHENTKLGDLFPRLSHHQDLKITNEPAAQVAEKSDVVFLCLPHMASQNIVPEMLGKTRIIDLSADFRLKSQDDFKTYYHEDHTCPEHLDGTFVYGLPELYRDKIRSADYVANPGCFALLAQIMLWPFQGQIEQADWVGVSGTSGGGKKARDPAEHPALSQNMKSYLVNNHRHIPEILQSCQIAKSQLNFMPSVGPFLRGIFATSFIKSPVSLETLRQSYSHEPFVRRKDTVEMSHVVSTNFLDISYSAGENDTVIAQAALDNLMKGASGNAVQNMNLMFGIEEDKGLYFDTAIYP